MELQPVFERVAADLGAKLTGFEKLTGGSSATVYALDLRVATETRRVVYRRYPEHDFKGHESNSVAIEFSVLEWLHAAGFAVAKPLLLASEDRFLVTEFIEGTTEVSNDELPGALDQMVDFLVLLHAASPVALGRDVADLAVLEDPRSGSLQYLPQTDAGRRARGALADAQAATNRSVIIHGDYWPGNVLWRDGHLAAVIDWEDAQLGDPLADLACARVELLCQYGAPAMEHFTTRYLSQTDLSTQSLAVWEIYVSSSALATMHLWDLDPTEETRRRARTTEFFHRAVDCV